MKMTPGHSCLRSGVLALTILNLWVAPTPGCVHAQQPAIFRWPGGKRAALSLSFDDARSSQIDIGLALLAGYGIKVTFYVLVPEVQRRLDGWKSAVAYGHEIGNHSLHHPCTAISRG